MRKEYTPVNLSDDQQEDVENSHYAVSSAPPPVVPSSLQQETTVYATSNNATVGITHDGKPILMAVAIPNSIRPPKVSYNDDHDEPAQITTKSILRRIGILLIGFVLTYMTFFESVLIILFGLVNYSYLELVLGLLWFLGTLGVLIGAFVGAYRGKWRYLVPGLVVQHFVGTLVRLFVDDKNEPY